MRACRTSRDITGTLPIYYWCRFVSAKRAVAALRVHRVEKLGIAFGLLQLVEQELDGVLGAHRVQDAAEHVHLLELIAGD